MSVAVSAVAGAGEQKGEVEVQCTEVACAPCEANVGCDAADSRKLASGRGAGGGRVRQRGGEAAVRRAGRRDEPEQQRARREVAVGGVVRGRHLAVIQILGQRER